MTRIHNRLGDPTLTAPDLIRGLLYNESYLRIILTERLGTSPWRYVVDRRVRRAGELLRDTDMPVLEVARAVGYRHDTSLARVFRERYGVGPRAYRRRVRAGLPVGERTRDAQPGERGNQE